MEIRTIRMDRLMIRYGLKIEMLLFMIIRVRSVLVNYEDFSAFAVVTRRGETRNLAANRSECFSLWREMYDLGQKRTRTTQLLSDELSPLPTTPPDISQRLAL